MISKEKRVFFLHHLQSPTFFSFTMNQTPRCLTLLRALMKLQDQRPQVHEKSKVRTTKK